MIPRLVGSCVAWLAGAAIALALEGQNYNTWVFIACCGAVAALWLPLLRRRPGRSKGVRLTAFAVVACNLLLIVWPGLQRPEARELQRLSGAAFFRR